MRPLLIYLVLLLTSSAIHGTDYNRYAEPLIHNYSWKEYGGSPQNWAIKQQKKGAIYVANVKGIYRYSNNSWECLHPEKRSVRALCLSADGRIYFGGSENMGYIEPGENGRYEYTSLYKQSFAHDYIWGEVWKIHEVSSTIYFQAGQAIFAKEAHEDTISTYLKQSNISYSTVIGNKLVVAIDSFGLCYYDSKRGIEAVSGGDFFVNKPLLAILPYDEGRWLILTAQHDLYLFGHSQVIPINNEFQKILQQHQTYSVLPLKNGAIAFGTVRNGVYIVNRHFQVTDHINKKKGLQNNTVLSMCDDVDGNLWLALDNGVDHVLLNSAFKRITIDEDIGTPYVFCEYDHRTYVGTNTGLFEIAPKGETLQVVKRFPLSGQVWTLEEINGVLYCGHHTGTYIIDNQGAHLIAPAMGGYRIVPLRSAFPYALQSTYKKVNVYKPQAGKYALVNQIDKPSSSFGHVAEDADGFLWTRSPNESWECYVFNPQQQNLQLKEVIKPQDNTIHRSGSYVFYFPFDGNLLFSSNEGCFTYQRLNLRFVASEKLVALTKAGIVPAYLFVDGSGRVWFRSSLAFGFCYDNRGETKVIQLNQFGQEIPLTMQPITYVSASQVIINTINGPLLFYPNRYLNQSASHQTLLSHELSSSKRRKSDGMELLCYANNNIKFKFSSNDFSNKDNVLYRFRLSGYNSPWSEWAVNSTKEFTNLPEGDYAFEVESKNLNNVLSEKAIHRFVVLPPWYRTMWAYLLYIILLAGMALAAIKKVRRIIIRNQNQLSEQQRKEIQELQRQHEVESMKNEKMLLENENIYKS